MNISKLVYKKIDANRDIPLPIDTSKYKEIKISFNYETIAAKKIDDHSVNLKIEHIIEIQDIGNISFHVEVIITDIENVDELIKMYDGSERSLPQEMMRKIFNSIYITTAPLSALIAEKLNIPSPMVPIFTLMEKTGTKEEEIESENG